MSTPALGYRIEEEDHQWLEQHALQTTFADSGDPPPEEIDPRAWLELWNQLQMGSCAGHIGAHLAAYLNWIGTAGDAIKRFSRMFCYLQAQKASGFLGGDNGATITGLVKGMMQYGVCLESDFPYPQHYTTQIPQRALQAAAPHKILGHTRLADYDSVFNWLANKYGGVAIGIPWTTGMAQCSGVAELSARNGKSMGGHAVGYLGYSKRKDRMGRNYLWLPNSHGPQYGNRGWVEVAPDLVNNWCQSQQCETIGMMTLQTYNPDQLAVRM